MHSSSLRQTQKATAPVVRWLVLLWIAASRNLASGTFSCSLTTLRRGPIDQLATSLYSTKFFVGDAASITEGVRRLICYRVSLTLSAICLASPRRQQVSVLQYTTPVKLVLGFDHIIIAWLLCLVFFWRGRAPKILATQ